MLIFLENNLKLDASGLTIGIGSTSKLSTHLTLDQSSTIPNTFTITTPGSPFTSILTKITNQDYLLEITLNQPLINLQFNINHILHIVANTGDSYDLNVEINYANDFSSASWTNSSDVVSVDDIDWKAPVTSVSMNNRLRSILTNTINALNQVRLNTKYYFFKEKYLSDIIEFAIEAGSTFEASNAVINYNSDGTINNIVKTYNNGRLRNQQIRINYTYADFDITRVQKRGSTQTNLETTSMSLMTQLEIFALNNSGNIIYNLGKVLINRTSTPTLYSIPYLKDYIDNGLDSDELIPDNIMSNYKYYLTNTITGWTVSV